MAPLPEIVLALRLRCRRQLVMHSADRPRGVTERQVGLNNLRFQAVLGEFPRTKSAAKKASVIFFFVELDHKCAGELGLVKYHVLSRTDRTL